MQNREWIRQHSPIVDYPTDATTTASRHVSTEPQLGASVERGKAMEAMEAMEAGRGFRLSTTIGPRHLVPSMKLQTTMRTRNKQTP
ncbi:hypothetical protein LSAT2_016994 [Lamellibrachia satsuma]|nr:hypothetical protein LSAT2_016994 [Lamellibrachia satsuma]